MKASDFKSKIPRGWGMTVLAAWLIASGLVPLLHLGGATVYAVLHIIAIAAGVLLLVDRT